MQILLVQLRIAVLICPRKQHAQQATNASTISLAPYQKQRHSKKGKVVTSKIKAVLDKQKRPAVIEKAGAN
jgi:hypothetical protein